MLSRFKSPALGVSTCAPADAWPPAAPSTTQLSRNAALRRALSAASCAFMRKERQLRGTDISRLPHELARGCHPATSWRERGRWSLTHFHGQGKIRSVQHPYRGLRHMLRGSRRGECDRCRNEHCPGASRAYAADGTDTPGVSGTRRRSVCRGADSLGPCRSEEHTSELQSQSNLVC